METSVITAIAMKKTPPTSLPRVADAEKFFDFLGSAMRKEQTVGHVPAFEGKLPFHTTPRAEETRTARKEDMSASQGRPDKVRDTREEREERTPVRANARRDDAGREAPTSAAGKPPADEQDLRETASAADDGTPETATSTADQAAARNGDSTENPDAEVRPAGAEDTVQNDQNGMAPTAHDKKHDGVMDKAAFQAGLADHVDAARAKGQEQGAAQVAGVPGAASPAPAEAGDASATAEDAMALAAAGGNAQPAVAAASADLHKQSNAGAKAQAAASATAKASANPEALQNAAPLMAEGEEAAPAAQKTRNAASPAGTMQVADELGELLDEAGDVGISFVNAKPAKGAPRAMVGGSTLIAANEGASANGGSTAAAVASATAGAEQAAKAPPAQAAAAQTAPAQAAVQATAGVMDAPAPGMNSAQVHGMPHGLAVGQGGTATVDAAGTTHSAAMARHAPPHTASEQVSMQISSAVKEGTDRIRIQLNPAELGRVDVKLEVTHDGRVMAVVAVERQETLDLLQRDARALERALQEAGLKTDSGSLSFDLQGQQRDWDDGDGMYAGMPPAELLGADGDPDAAIETALAATLTGTGGGLNADDSLDIRV